MGQSWTNKARKLGMLCAVNLSLYLNCFAGVDQGEKKVTLNVVEENCVKVFKQIEKQTKMSFFYSTSDIRLPGKVSISVVNAALDEVMGRILEGTGLEWVYTENIITIRKKKGLVGGGNGMGIVADSNINMITVTGKVVQADGTAIPGATVRVKRTGDGTTTDSEGNFSINNTRKNESVVVSSIGYETRETLIKGKSLIVQLNLEVSKLDETVIIGYGTTSRRYYTGNVSTIKSSDIEKQPVSNPLLALQGKVPGMIITQQTGMPGGAIKVQIRGQNSIANGNDPLYIVDGVPYSSQLLANSNPAAGGSPLNFINADAIESIDILKDADATAIYGSRGANGVVLITTKKGKPGVLKLDIKAYSGIGKVSRNINWLNTGQYLQMRKEAFRNDNITPTSDNAPDLLSWDTTRFTDWQKLLIGGTAHYNDIHASISGGTPIVQYVIGSSYHSESTVFPTDGTDQKNSLYFNINTVSPNQKLRVNLSGNYIIDNTNLPKFDLTNFLRTPPNAPPIYNDDGALNWANSTWNNPLAYTYQKYKAHTDNLVGNAVISYSLFNGLNIKTSLGYTRMQTSEISSTPLTSQNPAFNPRASSFFSDNNIRSWIIEPQVTYNLKIRSHQVDVLVGATLQKNVSDGQILNGLGFSSDDLLENIKAASSLQVTSLTSSTYKYTAIFSRLSYSYESKYLANLTGRRDGTSRFGPSKRFNNFAAVGLAWIFSNEKFIYDNLRFISYGKIRGSYGTTGNDQVGDYRYYDLYNPTLYPYQGAVGFVPAGLYNPDLSWEKTQKLELGLEVGLLKDRILITSSYFRNRSGNQLLTYNLPNVTGFSSTPLNLPALVQNTGWEIVLNTINLKTDKITWNTSINLTIPSNKLVDYPNLSTSPYQYTYIIGQPLSIFRVYRSLGVNQQSGSYQFQDNHGSPTEAPSFLTDRVTTVNTAPKFYGGVQSNFSYHGFQLDLLFQFTRQVGQNYLFQSTRPPGSLGLNQPLGVLNRWQKPGDVSSNQAFTQQSFFGVYANSYQNARSSDIAYTDASFIRLKNLSLSYQLPATWRQKMHIQNFLIFIQAQNLITFTSYKGIDPETQSLTNLPPLKVITGGIQISL